MGVSLKLELKMRRMHIGITWQNPAEYMGISNRVYGSDGTLLGYALFAEFDDMDMDSVVRRVRDANRIMAFGDAILIRSSSRGYHVIAPKVYPARGQALFAYLVDSGHSLAQFARNKELTLRIGRKNGEVPAYIRTIRGNGIGTCSLPHMRGCKDIYAVPLKQLPRQVGVIGDYDKLECTVYESYG